MEKHYPYGGSKMKPQLTAKEASDSIYTRSVEASYIRDIVWAMEQLLLHNSDRTIDAVELQGRVSSLAIAAITLSEKLSADLDALAGALNNTNRTGEKD